MSKPKVVFILPAPPLPLDQGYRHVAYNDLVQLSKWRDVHVVMCNGNAVWDFAPKREEKTIRALKSLPGILGVTLFRWELLSGKSRVVWQMIRRIFHGRRPMAANGSKDLADMIHAVASEIHAEEIHFAMTSILLVDTSERLCQMGQYKISFTAQNIEAHEIKLAADQARGRGKVFRWLWVLLYFRIVYKNEIKACVRSRFILTMAYRDHVFLAQQKANSIYLPPYLHSVTQERKSTFDASTITLLGHLAFSATGGGVEKFVNTVVPKLKNELPKAKIRIVGKDISAAVLGKCRELGIDYAEYVEDISVVWGQTSILVAPLLIDKGIRIRILEALYKRIPVVTTVQASTGFIHAGECLCIARDFSEFSDQCIRLLSDPAEYAAQQQKIDNYFEKYLSPGAIEKKWGEVWGSGNVSGTNSDETMSSIHHPIDKNLL
ncbi:MAG: glycosyltransferase family 4 protein [bacterium]